MLIKNMKDTLNSRVKHREEFRPFAGSVTEADAQEYFVISVNSPFSYLFKASSVLLANSKSSSSFLSKSLTLSIIIWFPALITTNFSPSLMISNNEVLK